MKRHPVYVVDAFTSRAFHGNPAAVCLLRAPLPDGLLQQVAAEMNLPETAFVSAPDGDLFASDSFHLRWFTPTREVPLCGHATLASAKVLFDELGMETTPLRFETLSGTLLAHGRGASIELDFPASDPVPIAMPEGLDRLLGEPIVEEVCGVPDRGLVLLRYPSADAVHALQPDFGRIRRTLPAVRLIVATARGTAPFDFVSRCFAPNDGIDEDPVTGVAHTVLGPYWSRQLGKVEFDAYQDSARGGEVHVTLAPPGRIRLRGSARLVLRGYLDLPDGPT